MKNLITTSLRYENNKLFILDQKKLPHVEEWIICNNAKDMYHCIVDLKVRGAPLIGIAAVVLLAKITEQGMPITEIKAEAELLKKSRPTAVNLAHCIERFLTSLEQSRISAIATAEQIFDEDVKLCEKMALNGATLIQANDHVMTYCNTGSLATAGVGTALGVIHMAHQQGKNIHVYVNETRPLLQGGRLTTWELEKAGISYTLICDNMAAQVMSTGKIKGIFTGADRVAANGDFANKIGTYSLAVLARYHDIPFYVVAPYTTFDRNCKTGADIVIEQRAADEVRGAEGSFGKIIWSPVKSNVYNPSFDVTPAHLVTQYVFDAAVMTPKEIHKKIELVSN